MTTRLYKENYRKVKEMTSNDLTSQEILKAAEKERLIDLLSSGASLVLSALFITKAYIENMSFLRSDPLFFVEVNVESGFLTKIIIASVIMLGFLVCSIVLVYQTAKQTPVDLLTDNEVLHLNHISYQKARKERIQNVFIGNKNKYGYRTINKVKESY